MLPMPKRVVCRERACSIALLSASETAKEKACGFYLTRKGKIELSDELSSSHLALVALHEKINFMHEGPG